MATSVGLNFRLTAAVDKFEAGMRDVEKRLNGIERSSKQTASGMKILATIEVGKLLVGGLTKVFDLVKSGASHLVSFSANAAASADAIAKLAASTGVAAEPLQVFQSLAEYNGISGEKLGEALKRMTKRVAEASMGFGEALPALQKLGLNIGNLATMRPERAFLLIAEAIGSLPSKGQQAAMAFKIFSDQGLAMVPMFSEIIQKAKDLTTNMLDLGQVLSGTQLKNIENMNDSFLELKKTVSGILTQVLANFAPAITAATKATVDLIKQFTYDGAKGGQAIANMISEAFLKGAVVLTGWAETASNVFLGFASALAKTAAVILSGIDITVKMLDGLFTSYAPLLRLITGGIDTPKETSDRFKELGSSADALAKQLWETEADFSMGQDFVKGLADSVKDAGAKVDLFGMDLDLTSKDISRLGAAGQSADAQMGVLADAVKRAGNTVPVDLAKIGKEATVISDQTKAASKVMEFFGRATSTVSDVLNRGPKAAVDALSNGLGKLANAAGITQQSMERLKATQDRLNAIEQSELQRRMGVWESAAAEWAQRMKAHGANPFEVERIVAVHRQIEEQKQKNLLGMYRDTFTANEAAQKVIEQRRLDREQRAADREAKRQDAIDARLKKNGDLQEQAYKDFKKLTDIGKSFGDWWSDWTGPEVEEVKPELEKQTPILDDIRKAAEGFGANFVLASF